jgi:hypothetical protein
MLDIPMGDALNDTYSATISRHTKWFPKEFRVVASLKSKTHAGLCRCGKEIIRCLPTLLGPLLAVHGPSVGNVKQLVKTGICESICLVLFGHAVD